jgi:hypothetical protein
MAYVRSGQKAGAERWPALVAIAVAVAVYALLPSTLTFLPRVLLPVVCLLLVMPLGLIDTSRETRWDRTARLLAIALLLVLALLNTVSLVLLVRQLIHAGADEGPSLLLGALQVWLVNIIVFGLAFWEMDRGGPVHRSRTKEREDLRPADFRFPQDENDDTVAEVAAGSSKTSDWRPSLLDYLYVACTNATAYSPTDTMPLTPRAKVLMAVQSLESVVLSVLVIARGVSLLSGG